MEVVAFGDEVVDIIRLQKMKEFMYVFMIPDSKGFRVFRIEFAIFSDDDS